MTSKNYYHEKSNGTSHKGSVSSKNGIPEGLQKRIAELERSQKRHERILERALDAIVIINSKEEITFFNTAAENLFGYSRKEVLGKKARIILPIPVEEQTSVELEVTKKEGDGFLASVSVAAIEMDGGIQHTVFIEDITERKLLERNAHQTVEQMKAQEEELRQNLEEMMATQEEMSRKQLEMEGQMNAINVTSAFIEFRPDGTIVSANELFLEAMGYTLSEIEDKHHHIFCDLEYARSRDYELFWESLRMGKAQSGEFKFYAKDGCEVWFMANYTPVLARSGDVLKVITLATNITAQKFQNANYKGQLEAVNRSNIVVEFRLDGTILQANDHFLNMVGYGENEIKGRHHSMFLDEAYVASEEYQAFWEKLKAGEYITDTFTLTTKRGEEIYVQATYNPIYDMNGRPFKIVEYATDITEFTRALKAVSAFTAELRDGNFDAALDVTSSGDLGKMIEDNLALRDTLKEIIYNVNKVVRAAGEDGNLHARLNLANAQGAWKTLVDSLNQLLQSIADPILEFNTIVNEMAKGDLTKRFQMQANGDIKNMGEALNKAIANLNDLMFSIGRNADVVAGSASNMLQKTDSMKRNTSEVVTAISQMAKGAQDQASRTDESSKLVDRVMTSANEMEKKANVINKAAEKGQRSSEDGLKIIKNLVSNMSGIKESAQQTSKSIEILTKRAEEIGRTLNVITDIASQTNLLALNAAIEAARAGDAGRGFAVVAEEIRKLAEDSRKSAVEIEKIISDVQKDTLSAGKAIEMMEMSVKDGNKASTEAENIFQEIARSSEETFEFSKEIQEATSGQKSAIDLVVRNIEQIVVVAEETAAGTQQVASSSQQLNNAMVEITDGSNKLSGVASELQACINEFKLMRAN